MKNEEPIKLSNSEKDNKILEFQRYWISYIKSHIELLGVIKENEIRIRFNICNKHESYRLNDSLYRYVETSINSLYYLYDGKLKGIKFPFEHKFLRKWRNINHHEKRLEFYPSIIRYGLDNKTFELNFNYYIYGIIYKNKDLKQIMHDYFQEENFITDITISDLIEKHHSYMFKSFTNFEKKFELNNFPSYMKYSDNYGSEIRAGNSSNFISSKDFINDLSFYK